MQKKRVVFEKKNMKYIVVSSKIISTPVPEELKIQKELAKKREEEKIKKEKRRKEYEKSLIEYRKKIAEIEENRKNKVVNEMKENHNMIKHDEF